jgi:uncharacterized membrane protein
MTSRLPPLAARKLLLVAAFVLASCASPAGEVVPAQPAPQPAGVDPIAAARAEGVRFLAYGAAPMFHLRLYEDRITLSLEGAPAQSFPRPEPQFPRWNGEIYTTSNAAHRLRIEVRRYRECPTQLGYHVVEITLDGAELHGCGRDV